MRRIRLGLLIACAGLATMIALAVSSEAKAQEGCSASCSCACEPDAQQCTVLVCNAPSVASCQDGSCGGPAARCCCSAPGQLGRGCVPYDCGDWPLYQCARSTVADRSRPAVSRVRSSTEDATPELCRALRQMNPEDDLWSYAELSPAGKGGAQRYRIRFASDPDFALGLQRCAELGLAFDEDQEASDKPLFLFRFRAPRGSVSLDGLHPALSIPEGAVGTRSGALAVRLQMTGAGQIRSKTLLFTSDVQLGEAVLRGLDRWFSTGPGADLATFEDVLFLRFDAGKLAMAVEHHHGRRPAANAA